MHWSLRRRFYGLEWEWFLPLPNEPQRRHGRSYNPGQKCWDTCTFSLKIAPLRFPPPPSPSQCCISGLKVHFLGATLTRGEGGRHFAQTRPSRASKTERLANTCHIFRLSQGLLSRIVDIYVRGGKRDTCRRRQSLGGSGDMLSQKVLKFRSPEVPFPEAISSSVPDPVMTFQR